MRSQKDSKACSGERSKDKGNGLVHECAACTLTNRAPDAICATGRKYLYHNKKARLKLKPLVVYVNQTDAV